MCHRSFESGRFVLKKKAVQNLIFSPIVASLNGNLNHRCIRHPGQDFAEGKVGQQMFLLSNIKWVKTKNWNPQMYHHWAPLLNPVWPICARTATTFVRLSSKPSLYTRSFVTCNPAATLAEHIVVASNLWGTAVLQIPHHFHQNKGGSSDALWFISAPCILFHMPAKN